MSAELTAEGFLTDEERLYRARVYRLGLGIGLSVAAAFGIGWPLAFITPMLVASFLAAPVPRPTIGALVAFPTIILVAFFLALGVSAITLQSPILALLAVMLLVHRIFYLTSLGVSRMPLTWALMGILMIPAMAAGSLAQAMFLTVAIFKSGLIAMGFVWISHMLIPDPIGVTKPAKAVPPELDDAGKALAAKHAYWRTLVILPLEAWVLIGQNTGDLKILIFSAMLVQSPNLDAGVKGGKGLIAGNTFGGVVAIALYELFVLCPSLTFAVLAFTTLALLFGRQIFGGGKLGPLCGAGFGTVILLIGMSTMPFGNDADTAFYSRIWQILLAAVYIVFAFNIVAFLTTRKRDPEAA